MEWHLRYPCFLSLKARKRTCVKQYVFLSFNHTVFEHQGYLPEVPDFLLCLLPAHSSQHDGRLPPEAGGLGCHHGTSLGWLQQLELAAEGTARVMQLLLLLLLMLVVVVVVVVIHVGTIHDSDGLVVVGGGVGGGAGGGQHGGGGQGAAIVQAGQAAGRAGKKLKRL